MVTATRRTLTSVVCLAAVACASFAWTAIVYLRTWADPGTPSRVVSAVLADPDARAEVVAPLAAQATTALPAPANASAAPSAAALIEIVLADPATRERVAVAFAPGDGSFDPRAARDELMIALGRVDPALATTLADGGPGLALPDLSSVSSLRPTAERWAWRLAAVAAGLFVVAFAFGDRRLAARRYAWWALGTGLGWWLAPLALVAASRRWVRSLDATTAVVIDAYVAPVRPWAIGLALSGVVAVVVVLLLRAPVPSVAGGSGELAGEVPVRQVDRTAPIPRVVGRSAGVPASGPPATAPITPITAVPAATVPITTVPITSVSITSVSPVAVVPGPGAPVVPEDVDVWAAYAAPAPTADEA